jgi:hypothetical protein
VLIGAEDPAPSSHTGPIEPRELPQLVSENIDLVTGHAPSMPGVRARREHIVMPRSMSLQS